MPETSIPPQPPKNHGGGAFIGAVILMLLAMGGLLYWKFRSKDETPAPIASVTPSATAPRFDEAPPPPPTVEPDAGSKTATPTAKKKYVASGPPSCSATCKGDAPAALRSALAGAAGSVRGCYERALRQNQMLQGKLMVAVKVGAQGNTCGASLASDTLGDGAVASCVLQKFRSGTFPAPIGGCVDVQVPINFTPKTGK
ncbi:MAG TPA: AgmX/PglI C-terminal domain-containing protein [Polyangiaceae bacterium]|jgi:outer membrane biosynthesis protein TonB|nr:AgmX/PglI C-terminal domain-containing protein [Polyangiaceae bacterium]